MRTPTEEEYNLLHEGLNGLHPIPQDQFDGVKVFYTARDYKEGDYIIRQGDHTAEIYYVLSGLVRSYYIIEKGAELNKAFYSVNGVLTSFRALLTEQPSDLNIQCLEPTTMLVGDYRKVRAFNDKHLDLQIAARIVAEYAFIAKDAREYQLLSMTAKERYAQFLMDYEGFSDRISDRHVASYLGVRPETLSRLKREFKKESE